MDKFLVQIPRTGQGNLTGHVSRQKFSKIKSPLTLFIALALWWSEFLKKHAYVYPACTFREPLILPKLICELAKALDLAFWQIVPLLFPLLCSRLSGGVFLVHLSPSGTRRYLALMSKSFALFHFCLQRRGQTTTEYPKYDKFVK